MPLVTWPPAFRASMPRRPSTPSSSPGWRRSPSSPSPTASYWCDGSEEEWDRLTAELVEAGTLRPLNPDKRPNSFYAASDPTRRRPRREPHLHLLREGGRRRPDQQLDRRRPRCATTLERLFARLHARPHDVRRALLHGPARLADLRARRRDHRLRLRRDLHEDHDPHGQGGARRAGRRRLLRAGRALRRRAAGAGQADVAWPCNETKYIVHFPETREIWSYGSGYGGNALLGKKCYALRIASVMARDEGWLAEHMLILKLTSPEGKAHVHRRRLPERLRQDQPRDAAADAARLEGRDRRRRHLLDALRRRRPAATPSTRRPASSASRPAPADRPTRTRSTRCTPTASSPTSR